jgi:aerobic-type carbon monoxide dehydrogenase small subunit (CoxS/CutS family)
VVPVSAVAGAEITTIEGIMAKGLHPVQKAGWISMCRNAATARLDRLCRR